MDAKSLLADVEDALSSHPDKFFARRAAERVIEGAIGDADECEMCAGFGYVTVARPAPPELEDAELIAVAAARSYAAKCRSAVARTHLEHLLAIVDRVAGGDE